MQTEDGCTPSPKSTPQDGDECARSLAKAAAWARAPPFVPAAKEKAAAVAAAPKVVTGGHARAEEAVSIPKRAPSFAEALRGKFAAPKSTVVEAKSQAPGVKRDRNASKGPDSSKDAKSPKVTPSHVPGGVSSKPEESGIVRTGGGRFVVEDMEEDDEEDEEEFDEPIEFCRHGKPFGCCPRAVCCAEFSEWYVDMYGEEAYNALGFCGVGEADG